MAEVLISRSRAPIRMCRICRTKRQKDQLVRWVQSSPGWQRDDDQRLPGRGYYTCSPECADKLMKVKVRHERSH